MLLLGQLPRMFCVVSGTLVATPSGPRPVESLNVGDAVLSLTPSADLAVGSVTATYPARVAAHLELVFDDDGHVVQMR